MGRKIIYSTGQKIGSVTYVKELDRIDGNRRHLFLCYCGKQFSSNINSVKKGDCTSCGCYHAEVMKKISRTHGHTAKGEESSEYSIWTNMLTRCRNKNNEAYPDYGGRGVRVCPQWEKSFETFFADMGNRPSLLHTLDRFPDKNGDYEPSNCRWATKKEQSNNRRNNVIITYRGESKTMKEWCEVLGINYKMVHKRIQYFGWQVKSALETPSSKNN